MTYRLLEVKVVVCRPSDSQTEGFYTTAYTKSISAFFGVEKAR